MGIVKPKRKSFRRASLRWLVRFLSVFASKQHVQLQCTSLQTSFSNSNRTRAGNWSCFRTVSGWQTTLHRRPWKLVLARWETKQNPMLLIYFMVRMTDLIFAGCAYFCFDVFFLLWNVLDDDLCYRTVLLDWRWRGVWLHSRWSIQLSNIRGRYITLPSSEARFY